MQTNAASTPAGQAGVYDLRRPDLAEARAALKRLYGDEEPLWTRLLADAGLRGTETDNDSLRRLLAAMCDADPVTALCARGLTIRLATYEHLTTAHDLIRGAE